MARFSLTILAVLPLLLSVQIFAQEENTVADWSWQVDHFKSYGIWDSACDFREENGEELERCYITYADVFAPRPKFAAAFMFVTPIKGEGLQFEFRFERGTEFDPGGFAIARDDNVLWQFDPRRCPSLKCVFAGREADDLAMAMSEPASLKFSITDRYGRFWQLDWDTTGFADALADMLDGAQARQLY